MDIDLAGLKSLVDLGVALGVAVLVKLIVEFLKRDPRLQGIATVRLVGGLAMAFSVAATFALGWGAPWARLLLKGIFTGIVAAAAAVGVNVFGKALAGKEV